MSLYNNQNRSTDSSVNNSSSAEVGHSPAYDRLVKDLSFSRFLSLLELGEIPVLDTKEKPTDYHRRRFQRLELNEKFALFDELLIECINSPRRLEPIGVLGGEARFIYTGTLYLRELITILESLPFSESLSNEALTRLKDRITTPVENIHELQDINLLSNFIPDEILENTEVQSLIDERIDWELQYRFDRVVDLMEIDIFAKRLDAYRENKDKRELVKQAIVKYLQEPHETWAEKVERESQDIEEDELSILVSNLYHEDTNTPQKIGGVITLFKVHEILKDPNYLELVGRLIDRELSEGLLLGVNQWLGILERNIAGVQRFSTESRSLIDIRREKVFNLVENLLKQDLFSVYNLSLIKETCRNFFLPSDYERESFCEAVNDAVRVFIEDGKSIYKIASLLKIVPNQKRLEIIEDPDFKKIIISKFEDQVIEVNQRVLNLSVIESVINNRDTIVLDEVIQTYRQHRSLLKVAGTLFINNEEILECPDWVEVIGKSHPLVGDYIDGPLEAGEGRGPEKVSMLSASWIDSLEYAQDCYINNNIDFAWFVTKQLVIEAKRLDHLRSRLDHIGEAFELLALSAPYGSEKDHNFRAALVFRMRQIGLFSLKVRQTLSEYGQYLKQTDRPHQAVTQLAKLIHYLNSSQISEEMYNELKSAVREIYHESDQLAEELGFQPSWFREILSNCAEVE